MIGDDEVQGMLDHRIDSIHEGWQAISPIWALDYRPHAEPHRPLVVSRESFSLLCLSLCFSAFSLSNLLRVIASAKSPAHTCTSCTCAKKNGGDRSGDCSLNWSGHSAVLCRPYTESFYLNCCARLHSTTSSQGKIGSASAACIVVDAHACLPCDRWQTLHWGDGDFRALEGDDASLTRWQRIDR
eukprot:17963-Heterococcus_DN1.PRE.2